MNYSNIIKHFTQDLVYRELITKSAVAFLTRNLGLLLSLTFSLTVARQLGPAGLGTFSVMLSLLLPLSVVVRLGLDNLQVRSIPQFNLTQKYVEKIQNYRTVASIIGLSSLLASGILVVALLFVAPLDTFVSLSTLWVIAVILPFHALHFLNVQTLKGEMYVGLATFFENVIVWMVALILLVVWMFFGEEIGLGAPIFAYGAGVLLALPLSGYFVRRLSLANISAVDSLTPLLQEQGWRTPLTYSLPMWSTALVTIALTSVDVLILAMFVPNEEIGIYTASVKLITFMTFPLTAIISSAGPRFSEAYEQGDLALLHDSFMKSTRLAVWGAIPIFLVAVLFPGFLLGIFGESFVQGRSVIYLLAVGQLINVSVGPIAFLLLMTDNAVPLQRIMWGTFLLSVAANALLIPLWGINGAAVASTVAMIFRNVGCWFVVQKHLEFNAIYIPGTEFLDTFKPSRKKYT